MGKRNINFTLREKIESMNNTNKDKDDNESAINEKI